MVCAPPADHFSYVCRQVAGAQLSLDRGEEGLGGDANENLPELPEMETVAVQLARRARAHTLADGLHHEEGPRPAAGCLHDYVQASVPARAQKQTRAALLR